MELLFKKKHKTIIILVSGEIDHHTSKELRTQTESAMTQLGGRNIIFGFADVSFMDSSGIGVMIGRYKQLSALGGCIAIANADGKIAEIIRLSGLAKIIPMFESIEDALTYTEGRNSNEI